MIFIHIPGMGTTVRDEPWIRKEGAALLPPQAHTGIQSLTLTYTPIILTRNITLRTRMLALASNTAQN